MFLWNLHVLPVILQNVLIRFQRYVQVIGCNPVCFCCDLFRCGPPMLGSAGCSREQKDGLWILLVFASDGLGLELGRKGLHWMTKWSQHTFQWSILIHKGQSRNLGRNTSCSSAWTWYWPDVGPPTQVFLPQLYFYASVFTPAMLLRRLISLLSSSYLIRVLVHSSWDMFGLMVLTVFYYLLKIKPNKNCRARSQHLITVRTFKNFVFTFPLSGNMRGDSL